MAPTDRSPRELSKLSKVIPLRNDVTRYKTLSAKKRMAESLSAWSKDERAAFARLSLIFTNIPGIRRWSHKNLRDLASLIRAKGSPSERDYVFRLASHKQLHLGLNALVKDADRKLPDN